MADSGPTPARELVFCHSCQNEWYRDEHGLVCPDCQSDVVEIIDPDSDPRIDEGLPLEPDNGLDNHHPWPLDAPDPEEGNIDEVEWDGPGGVHVRQTTFRSAPGAGPQAMPLPPNVPGGFGGLLSSLMGLTNTMQTGQGARSQASGGTGSSAFATSSTSFGGHLSFTATTSNGDARHGVFHYGNNANGANNQNAADPQMLDLSGIMDNVLQQLHQQHANAAGTGGGMHPGAAGAMPPNSLSFFSTFLNPANARAGDAVFTQEALDRVMTALMEQHSTSSAPGPASDAAIAALPKIRIDKEQLDSSGRAECSICMDTVALGDEVTELPCKHWFHGECVTAWLKEHDTCPQCRRGITPQNGDGDTPRQTGEVPRFWQRDNVEEDAVAAAHTAAHPQAGPSTTFAMDAQARDSASDANLGDVHRVSSGSSSRSRHESGGARVLSGIANWMGRRLSGGNDTSESQPQSQPQPPPSEHDVD